MFYHRGRRRVCNLTFIATIWILLIQTRLAFVVVSTKSPPFSRRRASFRGSASEDGIGVGIDLGTTFSAVAYLKEGVPTIVDVEHERTVPSVVSFNMDGSVLVGRRACSSKVTTKAYRNVKRILGTGGKLSKSTVLVVPHVRVSNLGKTYKKDSLINQIEDAQLHPTLLQHVNHPTQTIAPEVVSSYIVQTLKRAAEEHTGQRVTRAVIGVPAYFHDAQREATIRAAKRAGIEKVKLLREPEAAAFAYSYASNNNSTTRDDDVAIDELVLVFDLGGGTYDVSMLLVGGGLCEVVCTSGNVQLGGNNWDERLAQHLLHMLREQHLKQQGGRGGTSTTKDWSQEAKNSVVLAAEYIRIHLSNNRVANIALPLDAEAWESMQNPNSVLVEERSESDVTVNSTHLLCKLERKTMESLCREEFEALLRPIREVAILAGALLPGDTSPTLVDAALELEEELTKPQYEEDFYREEALLRQGLEESVRQAKKAQQKGRKKARDIAKQERKFRAEKRKLSNNDPDAVKVRDGISGRPISRVVLVGGATRMPAIGRLLAALTGVVPQKTVNPDEAVALGCAVHVGVLDGMDNFGKVLNPMQAAILRAMAEQQQKMDDDFEDVEYF